MSSWKLILKGYLYQSLDLEEERKVDAGLDDLLERLNPNWFCDKCKHPIRIDERYR